MARLLLLLLAAMVCGCAASTPPGQQHLSGKVTFAGKPIPVGRIYFLPDPAKGTSGAGGFAEIKEGRYDTRKQGQAAPAGALLVRIEGWDGVTTATNTVGQPLFLNYEVATSVGKGQASQDFDVPASAARGLPKAGVGEPP